MKKRFMSLLLAGAMTAALLAGCGSTGSSSAGSASSGAVSSGAAASSGAQPESDLAYVQDKGTLIVGITDFAPMDYKEEGSDEWIGFDADMAKAFAAELGVDVEFIEITWDNKIMELESKAIDAVWNGMTLTDEVMNAMNCSQPYAQNAQVVVVPADKADAAQDVESLKALNIAVESGSAGEAVCNSLGLTTTAVQMQSNALMEVASGASDACVIDLLMAGAMIGEGTSYPNLVYTLNLNEANGDEDEVYGVGFRKESDLADTFNEFYKTMFEAGTVEDLAVTYGVQEAIVGPQ